jgi:hypothetical protein
MNILNSEYRAIGQFDVEMSGAIPCISDPAFKTFSIKFDAVECLWIATEELSGVWHTGYTPQEALENLISELSRNSLH